MRNSVTPSPVASTPFESFYDSLSNREKDQFDQDEREQVIRQMGMAEIDDRIDWPEEMMELPDEVSDDEIFDVSSDDGAGLLVTRPVYHPRHILRKAR